MCGNGRGLLGRVSAFSFLERQLFPLLCLWHLPADSVLSTQKSTQSGSKVWHLPFEWPPSQSHVGQHYSFPDLLMYFFISLSHHWVMSIHSSYCSHGDSIQDGLQLRASVAALSHPLWYSMLKVNPTSVFYPMMSNSI